MICKVEKSVTLSGLTWVEIEDFEGYGEIIEIWMDVPALTGVTDTVEIGLFGLNQLTDGEERYNSGQLAENAVYAIRHMTESATDLPLCLPYVDGDILKVKAADAASVEAVEFIIYCRE